MRNRISSKRAITAARKGYQAGLSGQPAESCPYTSQTNPVRFLRKHWIEGWEEGANERKKK